MSGANKGPAPAPDYQQRNLAAINDAITWSQMDGAPVYGLAGEYRIATGPASPKTQIELLGGSTVICSPACRIPWAFNQSSTSQALIGCSSAITGVRWRGATLESFGPTTPTGDIFRLNGTGITIEDVLVDSFSGGAAIALVGDGHTISGVGVFAKQGNNANAGFVLSDGSGWRVLNCEVRTRGNALTLAPSAGNRVSNVLVFGLTGESVSGRIVSLESAGTGIETVVFDGFKGIGGSGAAIWIQAESGPITDVSFGSATVTTSDHSLPVVHIYANATTVAISDVTFANLTVMRTGAGGASPAALFQVGGVAGSATVKGVVVQQGALSTTGTGKLLSVDAATDVLVDGMTLVNGSATSPVVVGAVRACTNVVFTDTRLARVPGGGYGVEFANAVASGWSRGAIEGTAASASPAFVSVRFGAAAQGCFVEDADLGNNAKAANAKIVADAGATYRLTDNLGSTQLTPLRLGAAVVATLAAPGSVGIAASFMAMKTSGATTTLTRIDGGSPGDVLVVTKASNSPASLLIAEGGAATDNIKLSPSAPYTLTSANDTVTLLYTGSVWAELAHSING